MVWVCVGGGRAMQQQLGVQLSGRKEMYYRAAEGVNHCVGILAPRPNITLALMPVHCLAPPSLPFPSKVIPVVNCLASSTYLSSIIFSCRPQR